MKDFLKKLFGEILYLILVLAKVILIVFVLVSYVIFPCQVIGSSMYPTLKGYDRAYSFRITKLFGINRFDIAVIDTSDGNKSDKYIVKRVIGLPNETIEYKDNQLYIDGNRIEEEFLSNVTTNDFIIELKEDEYFCMGDNREVSKDSRYYGPFSSEEIIATNMFVFFPFSSFGVKK